MTLDPFGTSTRWTGPLLLARNASGGLFENMPTKMAVRGIYHEFFDDFTTNTEAAWTLSQYTSATGDIVDAGINGEYVITAAAVNNQGGQIQFSVADTAGSGVAKAATGRTIVFDAFVKMSIPADVDYWIGLAQVDTTVLTAADGLLSAAGGDTCIGFHHLSAGNGTPILRASGSGVANLQTVASTRVYTPGADDYVNFGIRIEGTTRARWYINGSPISAWTTLTNALSVAMVPTFAIVGTGAADTMTIDYVQVVQTR